jgi:WD40 repeat protein
LFITSYDSTLEIWDLEREVKISTFIGNDINIPFSCCAVSPDGLTFVAGDGLGQVHFLRLEGGI